MAQTTTQLPQGQALISISANGSSWTDLSGSLASVSHSGGDQQVGTQWTQGSDYKAVVASGKREEITTTVNGLFTVTSSEAWDTIWALWDASAAPVTYFKYSPEGGQSGHLEYIAAGDAGTALSVPIQSFRVPDIEDSGEIIMFEFSLVVPRYIDATIA